MRTTLTLDDDVATRLRRLARERGASFKEIVNSVLRRGLSGQKPSRDRSGSYRVDPFRSDFRPGVDMLRLNSVLDEIEVTEATGRRR